MAAAYRSAMPGIKTDEQRAMINSLTIWLDGFVPWAQVAASLVGRCPIWLASGPVNLAGLSAPA
jgi:hypothetical protein